MERIMYGVRDIKTKKVVMRYFNEHDAVQMCGRFNRRKKEEVFEVVKIITTEIIKK